MNYDRDYTLLKRVGKLYLSEEEKDILDSFNIDYKKCSSLSELIFLIESAKIDEDILENVLDNLEERNYYQNYKK